MKEKATRRGGPVTKWGPVAVYVLLIFYLSSMSNPPGIPPVRHLDKVVHFFEYGVLGFLVGRALGLSAPRRGYWAVFALSLMLGSVVGAADETYQGTVEGREKSAADFAADVAGIGVGLLALRGIKRLRERRGGGARRGDGRGRT